MIRKRTPKRWILAGLAFGAAAALAAQTSGLIGSRVRLRSMPTAPASPQGEYRPGQVLVKFRSELPLPLQAATIAAYQSRAVTRIARLGVYVIEVPTGVSVEEMVGALQHNPNVAFAEPNRLLRALVTPNDPLFKYQYALSNTGQVIGTVPGSPMGQASADIKAPAAWEETEGRTDIVIAIVDSGVDLLHPDLKNKIKNSGRDFVNNDNDATDDYFHGTMVAGIAAAESDNNEGIAGVAWNCKILPVKVLDKTGVGTTDNVAAGITWAADNGANVINLSLGSETGTETLRAALKYAFDKGVVIVAASGSNGGAVFFPAAYDNYVLAVAATDYNDVRASFSNFGSQIAVAAPGVRILSTVPTWYFGPNVLPYGYGDGTSFAAPHVAGLAALLKGLKTWLTPIQIMNVIKYSADDVNASEFKGKDEFIGYGRIDMEKALVPLVIQKKVVTN